MKDERVEVQFHNLFDLFTPDIAQVTKEIYIEYSNHFPIYTRALILVGRGPIMTLTILNVEHYKVMLKKLHTTTLEENHSICNTAPYI